jgi:hypothetical protein
VRVRLRLPHSRKPRPLQELEEPLVALGLERPYALEPVPLGFLVHPSGS